ncbi:MAG TPA: hypothetical protein VFQ91_01770 [Bryobacteraceae bacterium]|nr:hypothetical protein [Bryobacteraceae bacterium]
MDRFLDNAARIFEGGQSAVQAGCSDSAWTVLFAREGGIRMVANSDWPLDSLARESGAEMAYRVSVNGSQISVDGLSNGRRCALQSEPPAATFRRLLPDRVQYQLV